MAKKEISAKETGVKKTAGKRIIVKLADGTEDTKLKKVSVKDEAEEPKKAKTATKTGKKSAKSEKAENAAGSETDEATKELYAQKVKEILALAKKKKNVLEYAEISDFFAELNLNEEQFDNILEVLENSGIDVLRVSEGDDDIDRKSVV